MTAFVKTKSPSDPSPRLVSLESERHLDISNLTSRLGTRNYPSRSCCTITVLKRNLHQILVHDCQERSALMLRMHERQLQQCTDHSALAPLELLARHASPGAKARQEARECARDRRGATLASAALRPMLEEPANPRLQRLSRAHLLQQVQKGRCAQ